MDKTRYTRKIKVEITQTQAELQLKIKEPLELQLDDTLLIYASYDRSLLVPEFTVFVERIGTALD